MISMRNPCEHKWDPHIEEKKIMLAKGTLITRSEISLRIINRLELHGNETSDIAKPLRMRSSIERGIYRYVLKWLS